MASSTPATNDIITWANLIAGVVSLPSEFRRELYDYFLRPAEDLDLELSYVNVSSQADTSRDQAHAEAIGFTTKPGPTAAIMKLPREIRDQISGRVSAIRP